jgi:DNA-binding CsgD family transcriptional regulator
MPGPGHRDVGLLKRGLRVLAPHIQRAVRISHRIADAELRAGAAGAASDRAGSAVLCLRPDLSIVTANRLVESYDAAGVVRIGGGQFAFRDLASQRKLTALAASAPPAGMAFATSDAAGHPVAAVAARVPTQTARVLGGEVEGAGIILAIGGGAEARGIEISRVAAWFGLTPAEARLAAALASGNRLGDYCAARCVSLNAGRFLLKGIFRKTEVNSQAQLAALIGRLPLA